MQAGIDTLRDHYEHCLGLMVRETLTQDVTLTEATDRVGCTYAVNGHLLAALDAFNP
jgi:hypothetical protein